MQLPVRQAPSTDPFDVGSQALRIPSAHPAIVHALQPSGYHMHERSQIPGDARRGSRGRR